MKTESFFVRAKGIEPIRLAAPDPKSGLSTNFNTPAIWDCKCTIIYLNCKLYSLMRFPFVIFIFFHKFMAEVISTL